MLPCVWSVIDDRRRQNVVRTKTWHTRHSRMCSYHILSDLVMNRRTATWNLFVSIYFYIIKKSFNIVRKLGPLVTLGKPHHCQTLLVPERKLTVKAELNCEISNVTENVGNVSVYHQSIPESWKTWILPWILQELKKTREKFVVTVNIDTFVTIRFGIWMKAFPM